MRALPIPLLIVAAIIPAVASAQMATTPGFTKFDQQQFAKLRPMVGTWKCVDVPADKKPDIQITKQAGNYFVTRESGDAPNTQYTRWSMSYKMYYSVDIDDSGGTQVFMTKELDPLNSTWKTVFPKSLPNGKPFFPFTFKMNGNTLTTTGQYYDDKGRIRTATSTCTKVS